MSTARIVTNSFLFWLFASLSLLASCSKEEVTTYSISTGSVGGNYIVAGRALARAVNESRESNGFHLASASSTGSVSNINAIIAGDVQFGIAQADHQYQAANGSALSSAPLRT